MLSGTGEILYLQETAKINTILLSLAISSVSLLFKVLKKSLHADMNATFDISVGVVIEM